MREVELTASDGEFVAVVEIAPFPDAGMPDVVSWGCRIFVDHLGKSAQVGRWVYRESFAVVSFTPSPGLQK